MFGVNFDQIMMDKAAFWTVIAALGASVISAIASSMSLIITTRSVYKKEIREAFRRSVEAELQEISAHTHQIMASADILSKQTGPKNAENWRKRAKNSAIKLDNIRIHLRYQFNTLDKGFYVLRRVSWWVDSMANKDPEEAKTLLYHSDKLRQKFDRAIFASFSKGRPPSLLESWAVRRQAKKVENIFHSWKKSRDPDSNASDLAP